MKWKLLLLLNVTEITEHTVYSCLYTKIHKYSIFLIWIRVKQHDDDDDDDDDETAVGIFTSKVRHLRNTVHQF